MIKKYDYIICGAGLSGLILSHKIINDRYFDNKSVLIIDKDLSHRDHKTWCFWEEKESIWNDYVVKAWSNICFKSNNIVKETQFPEISRFDPVSVVYCIRPGQVFEIIRSSPTSLLPQYYRLCI